MDHIRLREFQLHAGFLSRMHALPSIVELEAELGSYTTVLPLRLPQFDHFLAAKPLRALRMRLEACDELLSLLLTPVARLDIPGRDCLRLA